MPKLTPKDAYQLFHEGTLALADVEANGIRVDVAKLDQNIKKVERRIKDNLEKLQQDDVWKTWKKVYKDKANIGSRTQMGRILFEVLGYECIHRTAKTGRAQVSEETLQEVNIPFTRSWLKIEHFKKFLSTSLKGIRNELVDGKVHAIYDLHLAISFRSRCERPNMQNQPIREPVTGKLIRECFIASPNHQIMEVDFCLAGDTEIETIDGPLSLKKVVRKVRRGDDVYVYGYSKEKKRVAVSRVTKGALTRRRAKCLRVVLDNGEEVVATPDHKFMLRDGSLKKLKHLSPGQSLMPFYKGSRKTTYGKRYETIKLNDGRKFKLAHQLIALDIFEVDLGEENLLVHHEDGDGMNNSLSNLKIMDRTKHMRIHILESWKKDQKGNRRFEWHKTEEGRQSSRDMMAKRKEEWTKEQWEEWKKKISKTRKENGLSKGKNNSMYGRKHTEEAKRKMSIAKKGKKRTTPSWIKGLTKETSESVMRISLSKKGKPSPNKGKTKPLVPMVCEYCGEEFFVKSFEAEKRRFCSKSCAMTYRNLAVSKKENHKIVSIEPAGERDVYNISVEGIHSYALSSGIIVSNCALEFRIACCFWCDDTMIEYANDETRDIHRDMATECYYLPENAVPKDCRFYTKNQFVFPQLYGSDYVACSRNLWHAIETAKLKTADGVPLKRHLRSELGIKRLGKCSHKYDPFPGTYEYYIRRVQNKFNKRFSQYAARKEAWWEEYKEKRQFRLMTGFDVRGVYRKNQVYNIPIQGPAFHCLLWSLIRINNWLKENNMRTRIVGTIHDSILFDAHKDELGIVMRKCKQVMTKDIRKAWEWIIVPLKVEFEASPVNGSWWEKKEIVDD